MQAGFLMTDVLTYSNSQCQTIYKKSIRSFDKGFNEHSGE
jgi:hypothetical protein